MIIRLAFVLMLLPGAALACACCAERGARFAHQIEMKRYELGELAGLRAAGPATLFTTACGLDCVRGIDDPQPRYGVVIAVSEAGVEFDFTDAEGRYRGTLGMDWPASYTYAGVDTDPVASGPDPQLYTEMRLRGPAHGTGDFETGAPLTAELIYAGRGNMCLDAAALSHWSLALQGEGAEYRLFGGLEPDRGGAAGGVK